MRTLYSFHGGVHPPEHKAESCHVPLRHAGIPPLLVVPLNQSIGNPAKPCVHVGASVLAHQRIADADGRISVAVHAPTSGRVLAIEPRPFAHPSGLADLCIVIEPDGLDRSVDPSPVAWQQMPAATLQNALADQGVVGLGGAVFPTGLKVAAEGLETLVINGAECEPYITCDDRLMRERAADVVKGIRLLAERMQPREVLVGIEDNKPEAVAAMTAAVAGTGIEVVPVPTRYPGGGAKQLIRVLTGKEVPHGRRSTEFGVQCFNVATAYTVWQALERGIPIVSRLVTLTGAVTRPGNVEALIGTPADWLMQSAGLLAGHDGIIMGGPMMGFVLPDAGAGITKATNCLIGKTRQLFPPRPAALPCIRCGECAKACPTDLQPMDLYWFAKSRQTGRAQEHHLFDCIECGACSYVCPSQIPLVDYYRFAKSDIWAAERDKKAAEIARTRHEFREFRIEREKEEKAARLAAKAAASIAAAQSVQPASQPVAPTGTMQDDSKRAAIEAAMERAAARKAAKAAEGGQPATASPDSTPAEAAPAATALSDDKQAAIRAAMERAAARKAAKAAEGGQPATASPDSTPAEAAPAATALSDDKQAAIRAAMERAAARKAAKAAEGSQPATAPPDSKPAEVAPAATALSEDKQAAIRAAMERAAARKAARAAADKPDENS